MLTNISDVSRLLCGIILITVPTIEFGGVFLLMQRCRQSREKVYFGIATEATNHIWVAVSGFLFQ